MRRHVYFCADITPPMLVPQRIARAVADATAMLGRDAPRLHRAPAQQSYLAARLARAAQPHTFSAAAESDDTCRIAHVPFRTLAQLYAVIRILRDQARWDELLTAANAPLDERIPAVTARFENDGAGRSQLAMSFAASPMGATSREPAVLVNARVTIVRDHSGDFAVDASTAPLVGGRESRTLRASDLLAQTLAAALARDANLAALVAALNRWACGALDAQTSQVPTST